MAVMTDEPRGGRAAGRAEAVVRLCGAAVSLALMLGVGVWGYRLVMRDMTGVPVVRAMAGPMREAPANPGGQIALNTGLAVNAVAALGEAAPPEDVLMLAPTTAQLAPEDMAVQSMAEAGEMMVSDALAPVDGQAAVVEQAGAGQEGAGQAVVVEAAADAGEVPVLLASAETPMTAAEVLALADMIAAGAEPLTGAAPVADLADAPVTSDAVAAELPEAAAGTAVQGVVAALAAPPAARISADVPGVRVAWRPPARPGTVPAAEAGAAPVAAVARASLLSDPLPAGTALVQLGAYETAEIAAADWEVLSQRFADYMGGKARVIRAAESGGEAFVRLRAAGFADIEDANRFCAVLIAEGARCIPVLEE